MSTTSVVEDKRELLNNPIHGIYIPIGLFIVGVCIIDYKYLPYALIPLILLVSIRSLSAYNRRSSILPNKWRSLELVDKTIISRDSAIYRFQLVRSDEILNIPIGYHLATQLEENSKEIRYYTPISSKFERGFFDILIKSYPNKQDGISKKFATLNPGQFVKFKGPVGRFQYSTNHVKEIGLIAGGSGITPILQVISEIITTPEDLTKISLIYANETENDILLKDELDEFHEKYPNFKVHYTLTNPPKDWEGSIGFITKEMVSKYLPTPSDESRILISGPLGLKKLAIDITQELGFNSTELKSKGDAQVFCF
ncbi:hypothetical protein WICMUC_005641 [Wickerhamomyces mucosus]|uniref:NADH-cytochrome b5 reductase n=1 Tax=Wickerhamomyces mucosus TaxID=1378264 RepID=A0A9P8P758_9ASCO|nr:hypothetical protein WICMUC_005641 [Wickerhamomyces mucosus]